MFKKLKMACARTAYYFFFWLSSIVPAKVIVMITETLIPLVYLSLGRMRKIAKDSLTTAFGKEKSEQEIEEILHTSFLNLFHNGVEMLCCVQHPQMMKDTVHLPEESRKNLEKALKENKGVVAISAHFGNFPLMFYYFSVMGYPVHTVMRPARDKKLEKSFQALRASRGFQTILSYPREICVRQSLRALRAKEIVAILMDQNTGSSSGVFVDFFGKLAGTPTGAVIFALRTGSPVLPMFIVRDGKNSHKILVEPHFYLEEKENDEETLISNVQKITTLIENFIRKYPTEWMWMHKRWKSRPNEESS